MIRRALFTVLCTLTWIMSMSSPGDAAELNGYTFENDSTELWQNPYFSSFYNLSVIGFSQYGYGDFAGHDYHMYFQQTFALGGIPCVMLREQGLYPTYSEGSGSFSFDDYSGYLYLAKDTEDNIHLLQVSIFLNSETRSWDYTQLTEGETTLLYPSNPSPGQVVFKGYVMDAAVQVGDFPTCMRIVFESHPKFPSQTVIEYLSPGLGLLAVSYNWQGRINGFSYTGVAPEEEDDDNKGWERWKDKYCFITAGCPEGSVLVETWAAIVHFLAGLFTL